MPRAISRRVIPLSSARSGEEGTVIIQIREFLDSDSSLAEKRANEFLAELEEDQVVDVKYCSISKQNLNKVSEQRTAILVVYRTRPKK